MLARAAAQWAGRTNALLMLERRAHRGSCRSWLMGREAGAGAWLRNAVIEIHAARLRVSFRLFRWSRRRRRRRSRGNSNKACFQKFPSSWRGQTTKTCTCVALANLQGIAEKAVDSRIVNLTFEIWIYEILFIHWMEIENQFWFK